LRGFLDSSPDQRQQILQELEGRYPQSQQYIPLYAGFAVQVANTCNNY
jgi:hemophore-related protein